MTLPTHVRAIGMGLLWLCACLCHASPSWPLPQSPRYVRVETQGWGGVFRAAPGQPASTPARDLLVYEFFGQSGTPMPLVQAAGRIGDYADDWPNVVATDVSALVPPEGWRWDSATKPRQDRLGSALVSKAPQTIRDREFVGYNKLDWTPAAAVALDSDNVLERVTFAGNNAGGLRLSGLRNVVRDSTFRSNLLKTSDQGQLYQAGRGKGGQLLVERCDFWDDPAKAPEPKAWGKKTYWRRWGIHIDDGASDVVVKDCRFTGLDGAICVNGGTNVLIDGCTFTGCRLDLEVVGGGTVTIRNSTFDGKAATLKTRISGTPTLVTR